MWIVRLALRRPYTFVVMAMLIVVAGVYSILQTPTDILPEINIPVIAVVWQYGGLPPEEMEQRFTGNYERALTTTVKASSTLRASRSTASRSPKSSSIRGTKIEMANAQVTAISQTLPEGNVSRRGDAASHRELQRVERAHSPGVGALRHHDGATTLRLDEQLSSGRAWPPYRERKCRFPTAARTRQVMVDIDLPRLYSFGLSPERRKQRGAGAEPHLALRNREDRPAGAPRSAQ